MALLGHGTWALMTAAALLVALVTGGTGIIDSLQTAARRRAVVALHQGAAQWLRPAIAAGLMIAIGANSAVALFGYVLAVLLVMASQFRYLPRVRVVSGEAYAGSTQGLAAAYKSQLAQYSWPFSTWGLFTALQLTSDRWALSLLGDVHAVGVYVLSYQLGYQPFVLLSNAVTQLTAPLLFRKAGDGTDRARVNRALSFNRFLCVLTFGATVVVVLASYMLRRPIVALFAGPRYSGAANHIPWLALAAGLFACGQMASNALLIVCKTRSLIMPKVVTALFAVALNFVGARLAGVTGVVLANVAFSVLYCSWMLVLTASGGRDRNLSTSPRS
jgi:O-antigen/teichoic acid export membrane protein